MSWSDWESNATLTWVPMSDLASFGRSSPTVACCLQSLEDISRGRLNRLMSACRQQIHPESLASGGGPVSLRLLQVWSYLWERCCCCHWSRFLLPRLVLLDDSSLEIVRGGWLRYNPFYASLEASLRLWWLSSLGNVALVATPNYNRSWVSCMRCRILSYVSYGRSTPAASVS